MKVSAQSKTDKVLVGSFQGGGDSLWLWESWKVSRRKWL